MTGVKAPLERAAFTAEPGAGEVVVAIAGCGVCHTDLGYYYDGVRTNHPLPLALGHEISGRVVATGAGADGWKGKAVIVPAVLPCGECDLCQRGLAPICRGREDARQRHPGRLRGRRLGRCRGRRRCGHGPVRPRRMPTVGIGVDAAVVGPGPWKTTSRPSPMSTAAPAMMATRLRMLGSFRASEDS